MNPITLLFVAAFVMLGGLFMAQDKIIVALGFWVLAALVARFIKMSRLR